MKSLEIYLATYLNYIHSPDAVYKIIANIREVLVFMKRKSG